MNSRGEWWYRKQAASSAPLRYVPRSTYKLKEAYVLGAKLRHAGEPVYLTEFQAQSLKRENVI
ncbi:MAG: hypothetical protein DRQ98_10170 [Gammaproteobacteria bacterium]|nr:MAG: hypothetical protein DRQ98_10170 [Gammaproteobacteria bacterium]